MKATITINLDNAAFEGDLLGFELAEVLGNLARKIESYPRIGEFKPKHMDEETYRKFLSGHLLGTETSEANYQATTKKAISFLNNYELEAELEVEL